MTKTIVWQSVPRSSGVDNTITAHFEKLDQFCADISSARISIRRTNHAQVKHALFTVLLEIIVPGKPIIVTKSSSPTDSSHDLYPLVHRVFDAARRQLQDYVRKRQGKVKHHGNQAIASELDQEVINEE